MCNELHRTHPRHCYPGRSHVQTAYNQSQVPYLSPRFPVLDLLFPKVDRATGNQPEVTEVRVLLLETRK